MRDFKADLFPYLQARELRTIEAWCYATTDIIIGGGTVLHLGGLKNARAKRAILIKILIFTNHERQLTVRAVPYNISTI